eukprot:g69170.t1
MSKRERSPVYYASRSDITASPAQTLSPKKQRQISPAVLKISPPSLAVPIKSVVQSVVQCLLNQLDMASSSSLDVSDIAPLELDPHHQPAQTSRNDTCEIPKTCSLGDALKRLGLEDHTFEASQATPELKRASSRTHVQLPLIPVSPNFERPDVLKALPPAILCLIFSHINVEEHFSTLGLLSTFYGRFLLRRSAWPSELYVHEEKGAVLLGSSHKPAKLAIPNHILSRLGRLGFPNLYGVGPLSLTLLANPRTQSLHCRNLELTKAVLRPLTSMHSLNTLTIQDPQGTSDEGLCNILGLPLTELSICASEDVEVKMSRVLHSTLSRSPRCLRALRLEVAELPAQGNLAGVLPTGLPIQDLEVYTTGAFQGRSLSCLKEFPIKRLSLYSCPNLAGHISALFTLPLEDLNLGSTDIVEQDLAVMSPTLKKLNLAHCHNITGSGFAGLERLPLEELSLCDTNVKDSSLSFLSKLPLRKLALSACKNITGAGFAALRTLPLQELNLNGTSVRDEFLPYLNSLQLKKLDLTFCKEITGEGFTAFVGLPLEELDLGWNMHIQDSSLLALRSFPLKRLNLSYCKKITGVGFASLGHLPLQSLDLRSTNTTDATLPALGRLHCLTRLELSDCKVSGNGLRALTHLRLRDLQLSGTQMSDDDLKILRYFPLNCVGLSRCSGVSTAGVKDILGPRDVRIVGRLVAERELGAH